ncbi:MAG TPA: CDP-alcohol phosphatidyltransferase family protein [Blastocatellia bacterium]|nr:CDP-alcohol phosphatidyltransferase family protein [Blastocatellia bacterium]
MATNQTVESESPQASAMRANVWTLANLLTAFRILLTAPFLYFINQGRFASALLIFFIASVTDFFDGYAARRFNQHSPLGRLLDPLADKLLTTAGFIVMALPHGEFEPLPMWLAIAVVGRDAIILAGSAIVFLLTRFREFKPTLLGKVNTFLELGMIVVYLTFNTTGELMYLLPYCYAVVFASVALSGLEYAVEGILIVREHRGVDQHASGG